jgi:type IV pilus assembly protein PilC
MKFRYQARTKDGELQVGFVEAGSKESAEKILLSHELFILLLEEVKKPNFFERTLSYFTRVRLKDLVIFFRQMAILFESQLPLNRILETLYDQSSHPQLKESAFQILQDIQSGLSFSQAAEKQTEIFSPFAISMIRSAEITGNLDRAMLFLADYTEKEYALVSKARSASIYPLVIILTFIGVAGLLITSVFPQIRPVFEQAGVKLPLFANIIISTGNFIIDFWYVLVLFFVVGLILILNFIQTEEGKALMDELKLKLPIFRKIFLPITISRFAYATSMLIEGGIPVAQTIEVVSNTINNAVYKEILNETASNIKAGMTLSESLRQYSYYFPEIVTQMIAVGEQTGRLKSMLEKVANFYFREADNVVSNLTDLIQPVLIIIIGILVALLFASILIPIYNLTSRIG